MGEETTPQPAQKPNPEAIVVADIKKYGDELVPGAAAHLGGLWKGLGEMSAERRAGLIHERLQGEYGSRFKNPEHAPAMLDNGAAPSELRKALARNADRLAPGAVDTLATSSTLANRAAGKTPAQVAGLVEKFLVSRDAHEHLAVKPPRPGHEGRLLVLMGTHFPGLRDDVVASVLRDQQMRSMPDSMVIQRIATTIKLPHTDPRRSGKTAKIEYRPLPPAAPPAAPQPTRNPDGTYSPAPPAGPPPRKSLVR